MEKAPDAFRTISEVADELDVPQHVLRFWETRFPHIKPMKRGGGRRYYRPEDVDLLRGIRHLLYGEGYTIRGVQRLLKDNGVKFVQAVWRGEAAGIAATVADPEPPSISAEAAEASADAEEPLVAAEIAEAPSVAHEPSAELRVPAVRHYGRANVIAARPVAVEPITAGAVAVPPIATEPIVPTAGSAVSAAVAEAPAAAGDEALAEAELAPRESPAPEISAENRRRLQAALYELAECRRLLEAALKEE